MAQRLANSDGSSRPLRSAHCHIVGHEDPPLGTVGHVLARRLRRTARGHQAHQVLQGAGRPHHQAHGPGHQHRFRLLHPCLVLGPALLLSTQTDLLGLDIRGAHANQSAIHVHDRMHALGPAHDERLLVHGK